MSYPCPTCLLQVSETIGNACCGTGGGRGCGTIPCGRISIRAGPILLRTVCHQLLQKRRGCVREKGHGEGVLWSQLLNAGARAYTVTLPPAQTYRVRARAHPTADVGPSLHACTTVHSRSRSQHVGITLASISPSQFHIPNAIISIPSNLPVTSIAPVVPQSVSGPQCTCRTFLTWRHGEDRRPPVLYRRPAHAR